MDSASDEPRSPRSTALTDFAAAREAAAARPTVELERPTQDQETPSAAVSSVLLSIALIVGSAILVVGIATSSLLGAIGATVGLAVAVAALVMLFRRARTLGRLGLGVVAGFLALVVGLVLGIQSYDERYFGDSADRELWDAVSIVGAVLLVGGFLVAVASLLGILVATIVRLFRRSAAADK